jgi:hypothetical protein
MSIDPTAKELGKYLIGVVVAIAGFLMASAFNDFTNKLDQVYKLSIESSKDIQRHEETLIRHEKRLDIHDHHINTLFDIRYFSKNITSNNTP